jgi:PAS domain-containing protein
VYENRVLRRIFGSKREEVEGRLHNEELHNLSASPNIIRVIK